MPRPAFRVIGPDGGPLLVSVPHAGRDYAPWLPMSRLDVEGLRPLEDRLVDHLVPADVHALVALAPRVAIDLNREEADLDPALTGARGTAAALTPRARSGFGLIPSRLHGQPVWRGALSAADVGARIASIHRPWHGAIAAMLADKRKRYRAAVLVDLHSMPSAPGQADVVLGDRYGRSAEAALVDVAESVFRSAGLSVARNTPYAGGATTIRHGRPRLGIHALQVEIDRRLYLDAGQVAVTPESAAIRTMIGSMCRALATWASSTGHAWPLAAE